MPTSSRSRRRPPRRPLSGSQPHRNVLMATASFVVVALLHATSTAAFAPSISTIRLNDVPSATALAAKPSGRPITTVEQFTTEILSDTQARLPTPVLVLFTAPWCGPCRLVSPVVKEISKQYQNRVEVVEVNTDDLPEVASDAGVLSVPTILIYAEGEVRDTIVGCVAKNVLARAVDKVLEDLGLLGDDEEDEDGESDGGEGP